MSDLISFLKKMKTYATPQNKYIFRKQVKIIRMLYLRKCETTQERYIWAIYQTEFQI